MTGRIVFLHYKGFGEIRIDGPELPRIKFIKNEISGFDFAASSGRFVAFDVLPGNDNQAAQAVRVRPVRELKTNGEGI